ncbi:MAG: aldo/keto reductase [Acidobacteriota bacterium]
MSISRREFLEATALSTVAANAAAGKMPTRVLGRTKQRVSLLGFGCGSRFLAYKELDKAAEALNRALDAGVTYVDTAYAYGNGQSEEWVGKIIKGRKGLFVVTKVNRRKGDEAMRIIEGSLKRLQRDQVDLLHMHGLGDEKDLAAIEAKDGVLNLLYKLREQKVARFIGVTCHADPAVLKTLLEHADLDCTQMALNAAQASIGSGYTAQARRGTSFEQIALPMALRKKMGVTAMKALAQEKLLGAAPVETLIRYAMSLPVAAVMVGMPKLEHIDQNLELARNFQPLPAGEMRRLSDELSAKYSVALYRFFCNHVDA